MYQIVKYFKNKIHIILKDTYAHLFQYLSGIIIQLLTISHIFKEL